MKPPEDPRDQAPNSLDQTRRMPPLTPIEDVPTLDATPQAPTPALPSEQDAPTLDATRRMPLVSYDLEAEAATRRAQPTAAPSATRDADAAFSATRRMPTTQITPASADELSQTRRMPTQTSPPGADPLSQTRRMPANGASRPPDPYLSGTRRMPATADETLAQTQRFESRAWDDGPQEPVTQQYQPMSMYEQWRSKLPALSWMMNFLLSLLCVIILLLLLLVLLTLFLRFRSDVELSFGALIDLVKLLLSPRS